ncbi:MAG TPA: DUF559 domain-containing protein [Micromonosporaceae bacterium]|nr:DUF559 domain-containing protein [Micromonosporaceae bacterium]
MARSPYRPRQLEWQVFLGATAVKRGLLTPYQLRSSAWVSPLHGVYADARLERDHELRCRAAVLRLPAGIVIAGPSAAWLHGVELAAQYDDDVHLIVPAGIRLAAARGLRVHHTRLGRPEVVHRNGLACTTPVRTAWDLARWLDLARAVTAIDGLLAQGRTTRTELDKLVAERAGVQGIARVARVVDLVDGGAQSPPESQLRLRLVLAGLPRPVTQFAVRLRSGAVLHPDLAWPEYRVAIEYDGAWHDSADQFHRDRRRLSQLAAEGWVVLHVTSRRMRDLSNVVNEVRQALRAQGWPG